jgi:hypothetical protein
MADRYLIPFTPYIASLVAPGVNEFVGLLPWSKSYYGSSSRQLLPSRFVAHKRVIAVTLILVLLGSTVFFVTSVPVTLRSGGGVFLVPTNASIWETYGNASSSLGLPFGGVAEEMLMSNQIAGAFSRAVVGPRGNFSIAVSDFSGQSPSGNLEFGASLVKIIGSVTRLEGNQTEIVLLAQFNQMEVRDDGLNATSGLVQVTINFAVNKMIASLSGSAFYRLITNLKLNDTKGNASVDFSELSYHNSNDSSSLSATHLSSMINFAQSSGKTNVIVNLQFAGVNAKTPYFTGQPSSLQINANASANQSTGIVSFSYAVSSALISFLGI